jgi:hypothetical protein
MGQGCDILPHVTGARKIAGWENSTRQIIVLGVGHDFDTLFFPLSEHERPTYALHQIDRSL